MLDPAIVTRFRNLFRGLERSFGQYILAPGAKADARGKIDGLATTWNRRPIELEDYGAHLRGERGLGVVPIMDDGTCWFGAIDIDLYPLDHHEVAEAAAHHQIPLILARSKSGGLHAFIFFNEPVPAGLLHDRLEEWAILVGHPGVEVFPKQRQLVDGCEGDWLNLCYFEGDASLRYAYGPNGAFTVEEFLDHAESRRASLAWLTEWRAVNVPPLAALPEDEDFRGGPPCLQRLAHAGVTPGMRNGFLLNLTIFCRKRHPDRWRDVVPAYVERYFRPPLRGSEYAQTIGSVAKKDYHYTCSKAPLNAVCDRATCLTREHGVRDHQEKTQPVRIGRMQKLMCEPPVWRVEVDGKHVDVLSEELLNQVAFLGRCLAAADVVAAPVSPGQWRDTINDRLRDLERIPVSDEASLRKLVPFHLSEYLANQTPAKVVEDILMGMPYTEAGRTAFQPNGFIEYLKVRKVGFTEARLAVIMHDLGTEETHGRLKGRAVTCWSVPTPSAQTEPFEVPRVEQEEPL